MNDQPTGRRPVTVRIARWSATHPWRAMGLWAVFVAAAVALLVMVPTQQVTEADLRVGSPDAPTRWCPTPGSPTR